MSRAFNSLFNIECFINNVCFMICSVSAVFVPLCLCTKKKMEQCRLCSVASLNLANVSRCALQYLKDYCLTSIFVCSEQRCSQTYFLLCLSEHVRLVCPLDFSIPAPTVSLK